MIDPIASTLILLIGVISKVNASVNNETMSCKHELSSQTLRLRKTAQVFESREDQKENELAS